MFGCKKGKILICGGAGYVGGYLSEFLEASNYDVVVYDNLTYENRYLKNIKFINGDIRDREKLGNIINNFDVIIWLAALVGDEACAISPLLTKEINLSSVQWLVKNYKGKIIFTSTCSVYGKNNDLLDESAKVSPLSYYAETKLDAERAIIEQSKNYLIFRLGTLFGVGDRHSRVRFDLVVNVLTKKAALNETLSVYGGGQFRPLLHVRDVAEAIYFGIDKDIKGLFNLSNKNYKICDIANKIKEIIPSAKIEYGNIKFEDLRNYKVSAEKFKDCGWKPKYDLEHGIIEIHQLIKDGRIKDPHDIVYSNAAYIKNKVV